MAEILSTIGGLLDAACNINEHVVTPIKNQFSYLYCYNNFIQSLRAEVEKLDNKRASLQLGIDAARQNLEIIGPDIVGWLQKFDATKSTTDRIFDSVPEAQNGTCLYGTCPNLKLRYSLSRKAIEWTAAVVELQEEFSKLGSVSYPVPLMGTETIPAVSGVHEFASRKQKEEEIMALLRNDSVYMIGICGMGGVGKTTMARKIGKMVSEEKLFDVVVMALVSQNVTPQTIQHQIAEGLGLELRQEAASICATRLHKRLMDTKKVLIVLDDVWERLILEELGIPSPIMHRGCKIMLTSRDFHACKMMSVKDATTILSLEVLDENEAFALFRENAGSVLDGPDLHQLAIDTVKECNGLPLAIVAVGRALRNEASIPFWESFLQQLRQSAPANIPGYLKKVHQPLVLSYEHLESDEARYLFLLCSLYAEDSNVSIEDLVRYAVALRIFSNLKKITEVRNRVHHLVEILKYRFLLMDAADDLMATHVKMHDVVRDMAMFIASSGQHVFFVNHDVGSTEWPIPDSREDYTCISITLGKSMTIPELKNYPRLKALQMAFHGSPPEPELTSSFLGKITGLRSLCISRMLPPSSLHLPTQLGALHLHSCHLEMLSTIIGELPNLEILSLLQCHLTVLPNEIGALTKLKLLDLSDCINLTNIASGLLSKLDHLEDLRLNRCLIRWEAEEKAGERSTASVAEVLSLKNLSNLEIWIRDLGVIPQDKGHLQKLTSYHIEIGEFFKKYPRRGTYTDRKHVIFNADESSSTVNSIPMLFRGVEDLHLNGDGSKDILDLLAGQRFENLKELDIRNSSRARCLATTIQRNAAPFRDGVFPGLRWLRLDDMDGLEEICDGPPPAGSFSKLQHLLLYDLSRFMYLWKCSGEQLCLSNLKSIVIRRCENLRWVFPISIAQSLSQLEKLDIWDCPLMKEIFQDEGGLEGVTTVNNINFRKLNRMILRRLPELRAFCKNNDVFEFPNIKNLEIEEVSPNFKIFGHHPHLFNKEVTYANLSLRMEKFGMEIFYLEVPFGIFIGLRNLDITDCYSLRTLFSADAFRSLMNLKELMVRNCSILEEIVENELNEVKRNRNIMSKSKIPQLRLLVLENLPKIHFFCTFNNALELPFLECVQIEDCPMMEIFGQESSTTTVPSTNSRFFFSKEVTILNLKVLVLRGINVSSQIFNDKIAFQSLTALQILRVECCHRLKSVFSACIFGCLKNLVELEITDCSTLEEVISHDDVNDEPGQEKVIRNVRLKRLKLSKLPKMRGFSYTHRDLHFTSLERLEIRDCVEMDGSFSVGDAHLSTGLCVFGIPDPEFASRLLCKREHHQDEDNLGHDYFMLFQRDFSFIGDMNRLVKGVSDDFFLDCWFEASAKFEIEKLSPGITYEIFFVIMLMKMSEEDIYGPVGDDEREEDIYGPVKFTTILGDDEREEDLTNKPLEQWIEIFAGEFKASTGQCGEIKLAIHNIDCRRTLLKGASIRPNTLAA